MFDKPAEIRRPRRVASCLGLLGWLSGAWLGTLMAVDVQAEEPPRYYQVEVVVFAQPAGASVELPPRPAPDPVTATDSVTAPELPQAWEQEAQDEPPSLPEGFQPPREPLRLAAVAARLNTGGYRLLWHQGWVQPPTTRSGVDLPLLAALGQGRADAALLGRISLTSARFLHLGMQLELRSGESLAAEMDQRRRVRPGVDQYYDHPRIGVIAVVTEIEDPQADSVP